MHEDDSQKAKKTFDLTYFTTEEVQKVTGLGSSTVYGIVKQSDGYIWIDSKLNRRTLYRSISFLQKPFTSNALAMKVLDVLDTP